MRNASMHADEEKAIHRMKPRRIGRSSYNLTN